MEELRTDLRAAEAALEPSVVSAITLSEFAIQGDLAVASGDATFNITNLGAVIHNFNIEGVGVSPDVSGGDTVVWESGTLSAGTYAVFCSIPGHREVGMEATLTVDGSGVPTHEQDPDYQAMSDAMNASILAYPRRPRASATNPRAASPPTAPRSSTSPCPSSIGRCHPAASCRRGLTTGWFRAR